MSSSSEYSLRDEMNKIARILWENREMQVPNFSHEQISELPNILQVMASLKNSEERFLQNGGWTENKFQESTFPPLIPFKSIYNSDVTYCNDEDPNSFILNRLDSKRFSLKPNLSYHPQLYRGQREHFPTIKSSFDRKKTFAERLVSNLRAEEFIHKLQTHPLFRMIDSGIVLDGYRDTIFIEMNYYGLAQHYNFNTGLVDFTSDILAAAFFATTKNLGNDIYEPYGGSNENKYGVIYVHEIKPKLSFTVGGFRSIGQQIYPRTGAQHGFFYQEGTTMFPLECMVTPIFFRHDINYSRLIYDYLDGGKVLFPEDDLSQVAKEFVDANVISGETFIHNLYTNHDNLEENLSILKEASIEIDWYTDSFFKKEELQYYYDNVEDKLWPSFCEPIVFIDNNSNQMKEALYNLPQSPYYRQYFNSRYYDLLNYHRIASESRARKNKTPKNVKK